MDSAGRGALIAFLAVEEQTLSGLGSPGSDMVGNVGGLLILQVCSELVLGNGIGAEPEVLLGVDEVPELG